MQPSHIPSHVPSSLSSSSASNTQAHAQAPNTTLSSDSLARWHARLDADNALFMKHYPGEKTTKQPVQTLYVSAHLVKNDAAKTAQHTARSYWQHFIEQSQQDSQQDSQHNSQHDQLAALESYFGIQQLTSSLAPASGFFQVPHTNTTQVTTYPPVIADLAERIFSRVSQKLDADPVEDLRADFEDGYGIRSDDEEDAHALQVAAAFAHDCLHKTAPPSLGMRIKSFNGVLAARGLRTLDLVLTHLCRALPHPHQDLPPRFVVTLPKVLWPAQMAILVEALDIFEDQFALPRGRIEVEFMVEAMQTLVDPSGTNMLPLILDAGQGRITGVHIGTYDYTTSYGLGPQQQHMRHPACDFVRHSIKAAVTGRGPWLSDGSTNILPIADLSNPAKSLTDEDDQRVRYAWRLQCQHVFSSLLGGYYQGWDLHPAQLCARYVANCAFYLGGIEAACRRLRAFLDAFAQRSSQSTSGAVLDDPATGQALLCFAARAVAAGAVTQSWVCEMTGLSSDELDSRNMWRVLDLRAQTRG